MGKKETIFCLLLCSVLIGSMLAGTGCEEATTYRGKSKILVFPAPFSLPIMEARFIFLADYLTKETGWKVDMIGCPPKMDSFIETVETEKVAFSFQNPYFYLRLAEKYGAVPVVKTISLDGRAEYRGIIVCREGSRIKLPRDLVGKTILAPSRFNVGGFLAQWVFLKEHGLDPDRDFTYRFGYTQEEILEKVTSGLAEAGFIREDVLQALAKAKGQMPAVTVIATTAHYPNHCIVAYPATDPDLVQRMKAALLNLDFKKPSHRFILERLRISGFAPASPEDFTDFQNLMLSYELFSAGSNLSPQAARD